MAKKIIFGEFIFSTRAAAIDEARARIGKYQRGETILNDDEKFFISLFELHHEFKEKIGVGISHLTVEFDFNGNRCIYIHRVDGTKTDISWVKSISPAGIKSVVSMALRRAVKDRVIQFKNDQLGLVSVCPILNVPLNYKNSHVSYGFISFEKLMNKFLSENKITYEIINSFIVNPDPDDEDQRGIIKDFQLAKSWEAFHGLHSKLELISDKANLSRLNR